MIQITRIKPIDSRDFMALSDLKEKYLEQVMTDYNPKEELEKVLNSGGITNSKGYTKFSIRQKAIVRYLIDNFEKIITALPDELENQITKFHQDEFGEPDVKNNRWNLSEFGEEILNIYAYDKHFRTLKKKGVWLARHLNIKACPYCNAQYTLVVKAGEKSEYKAKFQFDHYYSKRRYPYLSLSLFNLIPSCANCNLSKSDTDCSLALNFHPYHHDLNLMSQFKLDYSLDPAKISIGEVSLDDINIRLKQRNEYFKMFVEQHNRIFDIDGVYERHKDVAQDLINRVIVYNTFKEDLMKIKGLFNNDESLFRRYQIGNYGSSEEINERPLAKFYQDIAKQLGLID